MDGYNAPDKPPTAPYPPSPPEVKHYYYGLPSQPPLIARSSADLWLVPRGPEPYLLPKELTPVGPHALKETWEDTVCPAMVAYLESRGVMWTSLDPVRIGYSGDVSPPVIIWVGVFPGSLAVDDGVGVAIGCKQILSAHGLEDIHVEIRESEVTRSAGYPLYKPALTSEATVEVQEPFSTALGLPICAEATPHIQGTGGFFISDPRNPDKLYLVTARHVLLHPENSNELYEYKNPSQPRKMVLLFSDAAVEKYIKAIESKICGKNNIIEYLERRLKGAETKVEKYAKKGEEDAEEMDEGIANVARDAVIAKRQLREENEAIKDLKKFLTKVSKVWRKRENRYIGHIVLSPPIALGVGEEGFTEDWAVVEIHPSKINKTNFVGNTIDLGTTIPVDKFIDWMYPHPINPASFNYPEDRLHRFYGTISDKEMFLPSKKTLDHDGDPCIMVIKRGSGSELTVGCLNTIRSCTRFYFEDKPGAMSKEVIVLPRNSKSGAFSGGGDSGSSVVDGIGRYAGMLTGGAGNSTNFDCSYVTSINFLLKRMALYGLKADLFPSPSA